MNTTVLLVDDEEAILKGYQRTIGDMFETEVAHNAVEALEKLKAQDKYALVLTDHRMPGFTGIELLQKTQELRPNTVRMLITGYADLQISLQAINEGSVFRMLTKPCNPQDFYKAIEAGLRQHELITSEKELFEQTLNGSIQALGDILAILDPSAFGRSHKLSLAAREVAQTMGVEGLWEIEIAANLAEIGRITLPNVVARKRIGISEMADNEKALLVQLPEFSSKIISHIPRLGSVANIVLYQNKSFDGSGFPKDTLRGEYIPLGGRILNVLNELMLQVDKGQPLLQAIEALLANEYRYDPGVVKTCLKNIEKLQRYVAKDTDKRLDQKKTLVTLAELKVGDLLLSNIETKEGVLIINAGHTIRPATLQRIINFASMGSIKEPIEISEHQE